MKKTLLAFYLLLFTCFLFAQQNKIDSLLNILKTAKEDTVKVNILNSLSRALYKNDFAKAMQYANEGKILSEKLLFKSGIAASLNNIGTVYMNQGNYDKAKDCFLQELELGEEIKSKNEISNSFHNLGTLYYWQGDYRPALEYYLKALKNREELADKRGMASSLTCIGAVYHSQRSYDKANEYYLQAVKLYEEIGDSNGVALTFCNIGAAHIYKSDYDGAIEYFLKALNIQEDIGDRNGISGSLNNIGAIYLEQNSNEKALDFFLKALKIQNDIGDKQAIAGSFINIGSVYFKQKKLQAAIQYFNKSLNIGYETGVKILIQSSYEGLFNVYADMNNFKLAYEYHQKHSQLKDSLFNEESNKQITEMQTKYETEKKEQQIALLNKDKEIQSKDLERQKTIRNAVAGGLLLVLLFSFVLINRLLLIRKQKKVIEIEREKSEKLLLNILPKDTADELKRNNAVTPKRYEQVTVMFTDFKGFTTIAEKMSAEELVSKLDFIFKKFDEIISKYPIEKIKTIGDAYMCAGGLPTPNSTNPMDVVLAALEIQEFMERLAVGNPAGRDEGKKLQIVNWKLRIGIHTGSVIAGVVGDKKFAYDIWGDTVNTASRMESSGEAGKVNISGETYRNLSGLEFKYRGKIPAKNKGEIEMYFVEKK